MQSGLYYAHAIMVTYFFQRRVQFVNATYMKLFAYSNNLHVVGGDVCIMTQASPRQFVE